MPAGLGAPARRPSTISTHDGVHWYRPSVTALTTRGDTSAKSILAFRRFISGGVIRYTRRFKVGKVVAARSA